VTSAMVLYVCGWLGSPRSCRLLYDLTQELWWSEEVASDRTPGNSSRSPLNTRRGLPFSHVLLRSFDTENTAFQSSKLSDGRLLLSNRKISPICDLDELLININLIKDSRSWATCTYGIKSSYRAKSTITKNKLIN
jgi:hypothetical protein